MPQLLTDTEEMNIPGPGTFTFSGARPDMLEETEYTLVHVAVDISGSVYGFEDQLLSMLQTAVESCSNSPRKESLLVRVTTFNSGLEEIHGYRPLTEIDVNADYPLLGAFGGTKLNDAP